MPGQFRTAAHELLTLTFRRAEEWSENPIGTGLAWYARHREHIEPLPFQSDAVEGLTSSASSAELTSTHPQPNGCPMIVFLITHVDVTVPSAPLSRRPRVSVAVLVRPPTYILGLMGAS